MNTLNREKLWMCLWHLTLLGMFLLVLYFLFLLHFPFKSIEINWNKLAQDYPVAAQHILPIANKPVKKGQSAEIIIDFCKFTDSPANSIYQLSWEDGGSRSYAVINNETSAGSPGSYFKPSCRSIEDRSAVIPKWIEPGEYQIHIDTTYEVSPFQKKRIHLTTEDFEVIE